MQELKVELSGLLQIACIVFEHLISPAVKWRAALSHTEILKLNTQ